jgi:hypothetical protein
LAFSRPSTSPSKTKSAALKRRSPPDSPVQRTSAALMAPPCPVRPVKMKSAAAPSMRPTSSVSPRKSAPPPRPVPPPPAAAGAELSRLVDQAWDLAEIMRAYEQFIARFTGRPPRDPLARLTGLVHAWRQLPLIDPGLPEALLPAGWSGIRAAGVFRELHERWLPAALAEWERISGIEPAAGR